MMLSQSRNSDLKFARLSMKTTKIFSVRTLIWVWNASSWASMLSRVMLAWLSSKAEMRYSMLSWFFLLYGSGFRISAVSISWETLKMPTTSSTSSGILNPLLGKYDLLVLVSMISTDLISFFWFLTWLIWIPPKIKAQSLPSDMTCGFRRSYWSLEEDFQMPNYISTISQVFWYSPMLGLKWPPTARILVSKLSYCYRMPFIKHKLHDSLRPRSSSSCSTSAGFVTEYRYEAFFGNPAFLESEPPTNINFCSSGIHKEAWLAQEASMSSLGTWSANWTEYWFFS